MSEQGQQGRGPSGPGLEGMHAEGLPQEGAAVAAGGSAKVTPAGGCEPPAPRIPKGIDKFSVDEIVGLFNDIDGKILGLHKCSSDDFLALNAKFKGFYKEAKGISTSAGALFLLFSEGANRKLIVELQDFYESLAKSQLQVSKVLDSSLESMATVRRCVSSLYLPFRNLSQNGATMSLLLANISLGYKKKLRDAGFDDGKVQSLSTQVDEFVLHSIKSIKMLQSLSARLDAAQGEVAMIRDTSLRALEAVMGDVHYGLILFAEKHEESQIRIPQITSKTDSCSKSIGGIITNLQYQDIIRQKMEHIQNAHQDLMRELEAMKGKEQKDQAYWVRLLVQIRDISALQSAQLVATNREYQAAIEAIGKHFRDIAQDMETVADLCHDSLQAGSDSGSSTSVTDLLGRLKRSGKTLGEMSESLPAFRKDLRDLIEMIVQVDTHMRERERRFQVASAAVRMLHAALLQQGPEANLEDLLAQLASVLEDLESFQTAVKQQGITMLGQLSELQHNEQQLEGEVSLWMGFGEGADRMHGIVGALADTEKESTNLLDHIQGMSKKVSNDTHQALEGIRYYDFFAGVIGEITSGLNTLSAQIKEVVDDDVTADIERVRSWYTMASEHRIHDTFADKERGDVDLFGSGVIDSEEVEQTTADDDGLELF